MLVYTLRENIIVEALDTVVFIDLGKDVSIITRQNLFWLFPPTTLWRSTPQLREIYMNK